MANCLASSGRLYPLRQQSRGKQVHAPNLDLPIDRAGAISGSNRKLVPDMPTLTRLIGWIALLAGAIFGVLVALATLVEPNQAEMTIRIPAGKINPPAPDPGG